MFRYINANIKKYNLKKEEASKKEFASRQKNHSDPFTRRRCAPVLVTNVNKKKYLKKMFCTVDFKSFQCLLIWENIIIFYNVLGRKTAFLKSRNVQQLLKLMFVISLVCQFTCRFSCFISCSLKRSNNINLIVKFFINKKMKSGNRRPTGSRLTG